MSQAGGSVQEDPRRIKELASVLPQAKATVELIVEMAGSGADVAGRMDVGDVEGALDVVHGVRPAEPPSEIGGVPLERVLDTLAVYFFWYAAGWLLHNPPVSHPEDVADLVVTTLRERGLASGPAFDAFWPELSSPVRMDLPPSMRQSNLEEWSKFEHAAQSVRHQQRARATLALAGITEDLVTEMDLCVLAVAMVRRLKLVWG